MTETDVRERVDGALAETEVPEAGVETSGYAVGREVARGGMGRIVAAEDKKIGRPVALKELIKKTPTLEARFRREARVTARLQHPGIVPIYEIGTWPDGTPFYTMRMVEGRTLRAEIVARTTLNARLELLSAMIAACDAVAFAHGRRVIHRDLTPNNVLVGAYGETVVIDWGLAKDLADTEENLGEIEAVVDAELTSAGTVMGTLAYMPPEQARGDAVDERADVFALGCMLAHVLSGVAPSPTLADLAANRVAPVDVPGAPRDLLSIARKAMSPSPADRYPSARELADELRRFQNGRVVEAHAYTRGERTRRWLRAHRAAVLASLTLIVGVAVAGSIGLAGVLRARDRAEASADEATASAAAATKASTSYLEELGRQKLLAGEPQQAAVFLSAAYSAGDTSTELKFMLGSAMRAVEAVKHVLVGSREPIRSIHVSPDKARVLVVHQTVAEQWSISDGAKVASFTARDMQLLDATYADDGKTIISWGDDGITRVWSADSGQLLHVLPAGLTAGAALSPDGSTAITIGMDGVARWWDAGSGDQRREPRPFGSFVLSTSRHVIASGPNGELRIRDWGDHVIELPSAIWFDESPDHQTFVTCSDIATTLWTADGRKVRGWENKRPLPLLGCGFDDLGLEVVARDKNGGVIAYSVLDGSVVSDVSIGHAQQQLSSIGGRLIAEIPDTNAVEIHDAQSGSLLARFPMDKASHSAVVTTDQPLVVVPQGDGSAIIVDATPSRLLGQNRLISRMTDFNVTQTAELRGDTVLVRDLATGHHVELRVPGGAVPTPVMAKMVPRIVLASGSTAITYDTTSGRELGRFTTAKPLMQVTISNDGTWVSLRPVDGITEIWSVDGKELRARVPPTAVPPGIASTQDKTDPIRACGDDVFGNRFVRNCTSGRAELVNLQGGPPTVIAEGGEFLTATSLDDKLVAIRDARHVAHVFDLATGEKKLEVAGVSSYLYFSPSNTLFSIAGPTTEIRRFPSGEHVARVDVPDANVIGNGDLVLNPSGVWSVRDERQLLRFGAVAHDANANMLQWSPADGSTAMVWLYGHHFDLWDLTLEERAPATISAIVDRNVAWRLEQGRLVPVNRAAAAAPAPARAQVIVRDSGAPVARATVEAVEGHPVTTDANGFANLDGMVAGAFLVTATSPTAAARSRQVYFHAGDNHIEIDLELHATLSGHVTLASGAPARGLAIQASPYRCATKQTHGTTTSASGEFELSGLPGGCTVTVSVTSRNAPLALVPTPPITIATDDSHVADFRLVAEPVIASDEHHRGELTTRSPSDERSLVGANNAARSNVHLKNVRAHAIRIYRLLPDGKRWLVGEVQASASFSYYMDLLSPILVTDDHDKAISIFTPNALWTSVTIR